MKFLIDVSAGGALVQWLIDAGHDVVQVVDEDARMADSEIPRWAMRQERIIVTTDGSFGVGRAPDTRAQPGRDVAQVECWSYLGWNLTGDTV